MAEEPSTPLHKRLASLFRMPYEIRVRVTIGVLFILILAASLNSVRFFSDGKQLLKSSVRNLSAENLRAIADFVQVEPEQKVQTSRFASLVGASGLKRAWVVETDLLRGSDKQDSRFVAAATLARLRRGFESRKEIAGDISEGLPVTASEVFSERGGHSRYLYHQFESDDGAQLTLVAEADAEAEARLDRLSLLSMLFQILSLLAAATVAAMLLKITFAPYRRIKDEAIAAHLAGPQQPEAVDFAVETFQKVIVDLRQKEQRLQRLYAMQIERAASLEIYNEYILASMPSGVLSCDVSGRLTHFNRAASRILRRSADQVLSRRYSSALSDLPVLTALLDLALQTGEEQSSPELTLPLPDSSEASLKLTCRLLHDNHDEVKGAMVIINDLTEIRRLEAQVNHKEQMASLGEMSAGLAHQLRNSLAAMVGFAQLLDRLTVGNDQSREIVAEILREAKSTEQMLRKLLGYASPSEVKKQNVDLREIQAEVLERFAQQAQEKHLHMRFKISDDVPEISCDPLLLSHALTNLIQNSCDACYENGKISVEMDYQAAEDRVSIRVADTGRGIESDQLERVFDPFFTSGKAVGTGLGLSLARKWMLAHQGELTCQSRPGEGTVFTITLPAQSSNRSEIPQIGETEVANS